MDIQLIDCDKITFPTTDQGEGRFNKRTAQEIASGIKADRNVHPIVIRPDPGNPSHYLGIQGRHRHHAMQCLLKKQSIACHVLTMDDAEAGRPARRQRKEKLVRSAFRVGRLS